MPLNLKRFLAPGDRRFIFFVGLCSLLAFAAVGAMAYSQLYRQRQALANALNEGLSTQVAAAMHLWVTEQVIQANMLAAGRIIKDYCAQPDNIVLQKEAEDALERAHLMQPYLSLIGVINMRPEDEQVFILDKNHNRTKVFRGQFMLDSIGGRSQGLGDMSLSYLQALDRQESAFVSEAKTSVVDGVPAIFIVAVPVKNSVDETVGAVCFAVQLEYFSKLFISNFVLGQTGHMEILDDRGLYLGNLHGRKALDPAFQERGKRLLPYLSSQKSSSFHITIDGEEYDYAAAPVIIPYPAANTWWVLFRRSTSELKQGLIFPRNMLILLCFAGTALIVVLAAMTRAMAVRNLADEAAKRKQQYVDSSPSGVMLVDAEGGILDVNRAVCAIFNHTEQELLGLRVADLLPGLALPLADENWTSKEVEGRGKNGARLTISCTVRPFENGQYVYFMRDETELAAHRRAEKNLAARLVESLKESEALREKAEAANQVKSDFMANMSHEIRTPMNAILGFLQLVLRTPLNDKQVDYVGKMHNAARALSDIVNDILDFSEVESRQININSSKFDPRSVLEEVRENFEPACLAKGLSFSLEADPALPGTLTGDPRALSRILDSFMSNAIKFTHQGGVTLACAVHGQEEGLYRLRFAVSDTGVGFDEQAKAQMFQSFSQADTSRTREYGGMGLGLALSLGLARAMGGDIQLESAPGKGTTATLTCPFGLAEDAAQASEDPDMDLLRGKQALLVEDNFINQQIAVEILETAGMRVVTADNGQIGLSLLDASPDAFDVVLMDLQMPVMDGYTAAQKIREQKRYDTLPIIAMTAHTHDEERRRCRECGMNGHVPKPVDVTVLYGALTRALRGGG